MGLLRVTVPVHSIRLEQSGIIECTVTVIPFAARHGLDPHECLLVGDTDHDLEVARAMDWSFAFIPHGHQDGARIGSGVDALKHLEDVVGYCATTLS